MSYDISFKVKAAGTNQYIYVGDCNANITWNVRNIIVRATGLEWRNEENNGLCKAVLPHIYDGLAELHKNPSKYKKYESPNGWGTVEGVKIFFEDIIRAWEDLRKENKELADVATFWIE